MQHFIKSLSIICYFKQKTMSYTHSSIDCFYFIFFLVSETEKLKYDFEYLLKETEKSSVFIDVIFI